MKATLSCILLLCILSSYCQTSHTMEQQLKNYHKQVKTYTYNPYYIIEMQNDGCRFEVLLNDNQVYNYNFDGRVSWMRYPINGGILNGGKHQVLKLRLFPAMVSRKTKELLPALTQASELKIRIVCGNGKDQMDSNTLVYTLQTPTLADDNGNKISALNGKSYYEMIDTINLEVPYELEGWSKGRDLRKVENLESKVVAFYKKMQHIIKNDDYEGLFKKIYKKEIEIQQAWYCNTAEESISRTDDNKDMMDFKDFRPIENYKMVISDDGKMVYLQSLETISFTCVGLLSNIKGGYNFIPIYLYMPQGTDKLEIIR